MRGLIIIARDGHFSPRGRKLRPGKILVMAEGPPPRKRPWSGRGRPL